MRFKKKLKNYLLGRTVIKDSQGKNDYWIVYQRSGLLDDISPVSYQGYDGKYLINRTHDEIEQLLPHLVQLLREGKISGLKHHNRATPIDSKFAGKLPPLFIYTYKKRKSRVDSELDALGLEDRVWIDDTRQSIHFISPAEKNGTNWISVDLGVEAKK